MKSVFVLETFFFQYKEVTDMMTGVIDCWYETDFFKCGILTENWPQKRTGCFVSQRSINDCQVRKFRMLRKPWQYDFYGNGETPGGINSDSKGWKFMRDENCQIDTELNELCLREEEGIPKALFVQTYSVMAARTVACRTSDSYASHPSHFFKAAFPLDPTFKPIRWPTHEVIRQPAFFGIYPQFVYFCKSLVLPRRSLQDRTDACGGMMQAKGTIFPPDAKQPWPKVDTFRHCQEICQMFTLCKFVSYEFEKHLCWMYSSIVQVYPNNAVISGPKKCSLSDNRKFYRVEDFLESWTGSASWETQGIKYEKLLEIYAKEESVDTGIPCQGFEPPRWCKMLGGFEVALFYSETNECTYSAQNCSVIDVSFFYIHVGTQKIHFSLLDYQKRAFVCLLQYS